MKTNTQALRTVPSQDHGLTIRPLLEKKNEFISQVLGCEVKNTQVFCLLSVSLFLVLALIFATDRVAQYGWTAFFALSAVCVAYIGLRDMFKRITED